MSTSPAQPAPPLGSLLDDPSLDAIGSGARPSTGPKPKRPFWPAPVRRVWNKPRARWSILAGLVLSLTIAAFVFLRPKPQPDFADAPMDDVLDYALLTEDFNHLPIDKRLALIKELVDRVKSMSADDSAMMAMFAASIEGKMREQLERNVTLLAADMWDKYAWDYTHAPPEKRAEQLDQTFLDMTKMLESVAGVQNNKTDEERLADARAQAKRDQDMFATGKGPTGTQMARMAAGMRQTMLKNGSPQQQARGQQLMRDMTRHLRGQDVTTGKGSGK